MYASPVLDNLDPENKIFGRRFYREHCTLMPGPTPGSQLYVKDMKKVSPDVSNVRLLDNTPTAYTLQPQCGIHIESFYGDPKDSALMQHALFTSIVDKNKKVKRRKKHHESADK